MLSNIPTSVGGRPVRPISWIRAAQKDFGGFPIEAQDAVWDSLEVVATGARPDSAKPLTGLGSGVWELPIKVRGDAWRVVYALQLGDNVWVVHAFQKKSKRGIATPRHEIELVQTRIKSLKEALA